MASISVDVDLDDFELEEILDELEDRYIQGYRKKENQKEINAFIKRMKIDCEEEGSNKNMSIIDNIKVDFLLNNLHKTTLNDLEKIVNKC